jgi:hypothetical protein
MSGWSALATNVDPASTAAHTIINTFFMRNPLLELRSHIRCNRECIHSGGRSGGSIVFVAE